MSHRSSIIIFDLCAIIKHTGMESKKFKVVASLSNIDWKAGKVTGTHNGSIGIKEGELSLNEGKLASGKFVVDTTAITVLDITDPVTNAPFVGHLELIDFFASAEYPEAIFEIIAVKNNNIEGSLTIKGISHTMDFNADIQMAGIC
jgi:polyisoprenoid-binding protein YceI